jgi:hypothetical protein
VQQRSDEDLRDKQGWLVRSGYSLEWGVFFKKSVAIVLNWNEKKSISLSSQVQQQSDKDLRDKQVRLVRRGYLLEWSEVGQVPPE